MRSRILALSIAGLSILAGTPSASFATSKTAARAPQHPTGSLSTSRPDFTRGNTVDFEFTVQNPTNAAVHYDFDTAQQFDITVIDPHGVEIWKWSQDRVFAQRLTAIDLKPGQSKVYKASWDTAGAQMLPVGAYTATATITPAIHRAVRGGLLVNPDVDPNNIGQPTRTGPESGSVIEVNVTSIVTATTKFTISR